MNAIPPEQRTAAKLAVFPNNPMIDKTYKLEQTADALRYLEQKPARGKIVVKIE